MGLSCLKSNYIRCVILISLILWGNIKLKIYVYMLLSVVFYGWET